MRTSVVSFKNINTSESIHRLDAPIYMTEGVLARKLVLQSPYPMLTIGDVSKRVWHAGRWRRVYVTNPQHGITLLGSSAILKADVSNEKLVSTKYTDDIEDKILKAGWILISCSGTIGNCAFANAKHAEKLASQDVIRLWPNNILRGGLVYAYLASKYGYAMLTQGTFGSVIQHIEPQNVESIPIPSFPESFQKEVDDLIQESARLREEAAEALEEAKEYFETLYPIVTENTKFFTKRIKCLNFSFAAYNNNQETENFKNQFLQNSFKIREQTSKVFAPPLFKHIYVSKDNGYPFMTGGELSKSNMRYYRWLSPKGVGDIKDYVVDEGTLLLYKSGSLDGMIGSVFIVDYTIDKCCLSDHVIRAVFNDKRLGYWTFAFLKSKGGVQMLKSLATGAAIPFITPERLCELPIPNPDKNYEIIVSLVEKHINCISFSKIKENKAITMVEEEIEKWNK